jgi:hypothetical protein
VKAASPSASIASEAMEEEGLFVNEWSDTANQTLTMAEKETRVRPLGSGSDYTAFLQRYGVSPSHPSDINTHGRLHPVILVTPAAAKTQCITTTAFTIPSRGKRSEWLRTVRLACSGQIL